MFGEHSVLTWWRDVCLILNCCCCWHYFRGSLHFSMYYCRKSYCRWNSYWVPEHQTFSWNSQATTKIPLSWPHFESEEATVMSLCLNILYLCHAVYQKYDVKQNIEWIIYKLLLKIAIYEINYTLGFGLSWSVEFTRIYLSWQKQDSPPYKIIDYNLLITSTNKDWLSLSP